MELLRCKWTPRRRRRWLRYLIWFRSKTREHLQSMKLMPLISETKVSSSNKNQFQNCRLILRLSKHRRILSAITKLIKRKTMSIIHIWLRPRKCWSQQSREVQIEKTGNQRWTALSHLEVKIGIIKDSGSEIRINNNGKLTPETFSTRSSTLKPIMEEAMIINRRPIKAAKRCKHQGIKQLLKE